MKILFITENLRPNSGWGRYSADMTGALKLAGVDVVVHEIENPLRFKMHFFLGWWQVLKLYVKYRYQEFDIIHCAVEPYAFIATLFAGLKGAKYAQTVHGTYGILFLAHPVYKFFQRYAYKRAYIIVAVSNYTKRRVEEYMKLSNLVVIPNGIGSLPVEKKETNREKKVIISIGGVKRRKGYHLVIEALSRVKKDIGPFSYYIVGQEQDAEYCGVLRELIHKKNLEEHVVIAGSVFDEEKEKFYEKADLFILTPVSEGLYFEGFGLVYLEANARGLPVIGTFDSGAEDAIIDGETGFLVSQNSPDKIAEKILAILKNEELTRRLSENGIRWARKHNWNNVVESYIKAYR